MEKGASKCKVVLIGDPDLNLLDLSSQAENSPFPSTHTPNKRWSIETVLTVWRFMINIPSALLYTTQIKWKSVIMSIKMSSSYACTLESIDHMHVIEERNGNTIWCAYITNLFSANNNYSLLIILSLSKLGDFSSHCYSNRLLYIEMWGRCSWEFISQLMQFPYISSEHAALFGLSSLCPFSRKVERETGSTPG